MLPSRRHLLLTLAATVLPSLDASAAASTSASRVTLPTVWREGLDPAAYLVSEKYDGVRGHWDGATLRFRSGRVVPAPPWFLARLPPQPLDGELWLGRGRFDALSGLVRREVPVDAEWRQVRFMVFELPDAAGTFAERAQRIAAIAADTAWPALVAAEQAEVADRAALARRLAATVEGGGEGLVLHLASAPYSAGRSDAMMKLKPSLDAEATVVGHREGKGKYAGLLGALVVRNAEGRSFMVGSGLSDEQRRDPPPIGSVITYRYRDLTATGLPRFATFLRTYAAL